MSKLSSFENEILLPVLAEIINNRVAEPSEDKSKENKVKKEFSVKASKGKKLKLSELRKYLTSPEGRTSILDPAIKVARRLRIVGDKPRVNNKRKEQQKKEVKQELLNPTPVVKIDAENAINNALRIFTENIVIPPPPRRGRPRAEQVEIELPTAEEQEQKQAREVLRETRQQLESKKPEEMTRREAERALRELEETEGDTEPSSAEEMAIQFLPRVERKRREVKQRVPRVQGIDFSLSEREAKNAFELLPKVANIPNTARKVIRSLLQGLTSVEDFVSTASSRTLIRNVGAGLAIIAQTQMRGFTGMQKIRSNELSLALATAVAIGTTDVLRNAQKDFDRSGIKSKAVKARMKDKPKGDDDPFKKPSPSDAKQEGERLIDDLEKADAQEREIFKQNTGLDTKEAVEMVDREIKAIEQTGSISGLFQEQFFKVMKALRDLPASAVVSALGSIPVVGEIREQPRPPTPSFGIEEIPKPLPREIRERGLPMPQSQEDLEAERARQIRFRAEERKRQLRERLTRELPVPRVERLREEVRREVPLTGRKLPELSQRQKRDEAEKLETITEEEPREEPIELPKVKIPKVFIPKKVKMPSAPQQEVVQQEDQKDNSQARPRYIIPSTKVLDPYKTKEEQKAEFDLTAGFGFDIPYAMNNVILEENPLMQDYIMEERLRYDNSGMYEGNNDWNSIEKVEIPSKPNEDILPRMEFKQDYQELPYNPNITMTQNIAYNNFTQIVPLDPQENSIREGMLEGIQL